MPPQPPKAQLLRFGIFEANIPARELRKHGIRVRLPGQPFSILTILLERPGEVVTREEMRQKLWASNTFVDFEHGLNSAIKKLRGALGDSAENSRYIETVPRLGYRFIAPVEQVSPAAPPVNLSTVPDPSGIPAAAETLSKRHSRTFLAISIGLALAASTLFAWFHFRSRPKAQLESVAETHAAAKEHESGRSDNQPVQSAYSAEARDRFLKGMYFWNKRTVGGFRLAIEHFQQATTLDPNYAAAYAGLANSYTLLTAYSSASASLYIPQARAAALRAVQLDPNLAEAHTALALVVQNHDWDWQTSEREYRRAIELNPNYATAHQWYAEHLMWLGRFDEAVAESDRARQLDPLSIIIATDHGAILYFSRHYDGAIHQLHSVLQRDPNFPRAVALLLHAYVENGMYAQALAEAEPVRRLWGEGPFYWTVRTHVYARMGRREQARRELEKLEKLSRHGDVDLETLFWSHLAVGDKEEALADLERAYSGQSNFLTGLKVEPAYDPLRGDPRFQDLLRRVGLADSSTASK